MKGKQAFIPEQDKRINTTESYEREIIHMIYDSETIQEAAEKLSSFIFEVDSIELTSELMEAVIAFCVIHKMRTGIDFWGNDTDSAEKYANMDSAKLEVLKAIGAFIYQGVSDKAKFEDDLITFWNDIVVKYESVNAIHGDTEYEAIDDNQAGLVGIKTEIVDAAEYMDMDDYELDYVISFEDSYDGRINTSWSEMMMNQRLTNSVCQTRNVEIAFCVRL
jgi:hypothetical protein